MDFGMQLKANGRWFVGIYNSEYNEFFEEMTGVPIAHFEECTQTIELPDQTQPPEVTE